MQSEKEIIELTKKVLNLQEEILETKERLSEIERKLHQLEPLEMPTEISGLPITFWLQLYAKKGGDKR